jgi:hypothetical protein
MAWFSAKIGAQMQALREDPGTGIPLLPFLWKSRVKSSPQLFDGLRIDFS